jgi:hypothetical protein
MKSFLFTTVITITILLLQSWGFCEGNKLKIGGYYKELFVSTKSNVTKETFFANTQRLRLKFKKKIAPWQFNLTIDNEALIHDFADKPDFSFVDSRRQNRTAFLDLDKVTVEKDHLYLKHTIHRASIKYYKSDFQATIGKQAVDWGKMRFYSPLDIFNSIRLTDLEPGERMGIDAVNLNYSPDSFSGINLVYSQGKDSETTAVGLKAYGKLSTYDLSLIVASANKQKTIGFSFDGYIKDAGFRGEISYAKAHFDNNSAYSRVALGMDYNFPNKVYLLIEQFYNGGHEEIDPFFYTFSNHRVRQILSLQKHLSSILTSYELTPLIKLQNTFIYDWDGNSASVNPQFKYNVHSNVDLTLGAQIYAGGETESLFETNSEFDVYENAYYLQLKWFF